MHCVMRPAVSMAVSRLVCRRGRTAKEKRRRAATAAGSQGGRTHPRTRPGRSSHGAARSAGLARAAAHRDGHAESERHRRPGTARGAGRRRRPASKSSRSKNAGGARQGRRATPTPSSAATMRSATTACSPPAKRVALGGGDVRGRRSPASASRRSRSPASSSPTCARWPGPVMAEHTIALMFALSRSLQVSIGRQATGEGWNRNFAGSQPQALTGKTAAGGRTRRHRHRGGAPRARAGHEGDRHAQQLARRSGLRELRGAVRRAADADRRRPTWWFRRCRWCRPPPTCSTRKCSRA